MDLHFNIVNFMLTRNVLHILDFTSVVSTIYECIVSKIFKIQLNGIFLLKYRRFRHKGKFRNIYYYLGLQKLLQTSV